MDKQFILHMFTTEKNLSPFDVIMALDAGWLSAIPYTNIQADEINGLIQDAIFARSPKALKRVGVFISGKDFAKTLELLQLAKNAMVPPFQASILADPSGAFTSAASITAYIEDLLNKHNHTAIEDKRILILTGNGPVGQVAALLFARLGATVTLLNNSLDLAKSAADQCNQHTDPPSPKIHAAGIADKTALLAQADIILATLSCNISLQEKELRTHAANLKICADINPAPPFAIQGLSPYAGLQNLEYNQALGIGALAMGEIKYQVQMQLLKLLTQSDSPVYLSYTDAYKTAKEYLQSKAT